MNLETFLELSHQEIAQIIRDQEPMVAVFVLNGTRRWFLLEHQLHQKLDQSEYFAIITRRLIELCELFFDHGIHSLVLPIISPYLLKKRGPEYTQMVVQSLGQLAFGDPYRQFYRERDVRVHFYGDIHTFGDADVNAHLSQQFDHVTQETALNQTNRLFWGVCAHDATDTIVNYSIDFFQQHGRKPTKEELVEMYYGEALPPVDFFISSSKPRAFDMPLISNGREDLYFTVAPSPYLSIKGFRTILYDHLFNRQATNIDYQPQQEEQVWESLRDFYHIHQDRTIGVGTRNDQWGIWHPTPQLLAPAKIA